jgi:hypothetical protein
VSGRYSSESPLPGECVCGWSLPALGVSLFEAETKSVSRRKDISIVVLIRCPTEGCGARYMLTLSPEEPVSAAPKSKALLGVVKKEP